jgi:predicted nucleic acid-binding protein
MSAVFSDTSYYVALLNPRDELHEQVMRFSASFSQPTVTTDFVLIEVANFLKFPADRQKFATLVKYLNAETTATVVPCSRDWFRDGLRLFESREDKTWSLTDCISFAVMNELGVTEALTADRHFEQAGFKALLLG